MIRADMHIHTYFSDGTASPAEVVAAAVGAGLGLVCVTDHDTMDGCGRVKELASAAGVRAVSGLEISAYADVKVHVLGYGLDTSCAAYKNYYKNAVEGSFARCYDVLAKLKARIPDCAITTDLIVGFPGETDEDFEATLDLVKKVNFASAFTFVYSKRQGTKAAEMPDQVPEEVSKERIMRLVELVNSQTRSLSETYLGKTIEILCEDYDDKRGMYMGRDEYGRMGYFISSQNMIGKFVKIQIKQVNGISLTGSAVV